MGTTKQSTYMPMWTTVHTGPVFTLPKGVYSHLRHNEIRDTFASLLREVCHVVEIEPKLQSLKGESFQYKKPLLKMKLDLTSKQMGSAEADSAEPFSVIIGHKKFYTNKNSFCTSEARLSRHVHVPSRHSLDALNST